MILGPRHKDTGETMDSIIAHLPDELSHDAVGLFHFVPTGRVSFGLSGDDLTEFVRRGIDALLSAGAVPVRHVRHSGYEWIEQNQYGKHKHEIVDAIVSEWLAMPDDPQVLCGDGVIRIFQST